jgi:Ca2+-binding RTX toxin-like protein
MADFILTQIGASLTGTSAADNMTFGIQVVDTVPFVATGSLSGGAGNDGFFTLDPRAFFNGIQYAYGNEGNDNITLAGLFTAYGGKDDDIIREIGIEGADPVAAQQIFGNEGKDTIDAGGGNDYIEGNQGDDSIIAGQGNDLVYGGKENDIIWGDENDPFATIGGNDTLYGNEGNDTINGELGNDLIWGGQGNDVINGGAGSDTIYGNEDNDNINGGAGSDFLQGGKGNDTIEGGGSPLEGLPGDTIIGAEGQDRLTGNDEPNNLTTGTVTSNAQYDDIFRYDYGPSANVGVDNVDFITNFQSRAIAPVPPNTQLTDKLSFAVGADAVLAGLNFNTGTSYDVNRLVGGPVDPAVAPIAPAGPASATYDAVFEVIRKAFSDGLGGLPANSSPVASTNDRLQVYNFTITVGGSIAGSNQFLYINNGDNAVTQADMLIQGVNVVDGFSTVTGVAPVSDIIFA